MFDMNNPTGLTSTYNPSEQTLAQQKYAKEQKDIRDKLLQKIETYVQENQCRFIGIISMMDFLQQLVSACGGEPNIQFLEVYRGYIKFKTRLPITSTIYPFLPAGEGNLKAQEVFVYYLLRINCIQGVKWIPAQDEGSIILVEFDLA